MSNKPKPNQFRSWYTMTWYAFKAAMRNKSNLFFSFIFPIALIAAFGLIGNFTTTYKIGLPSENDQSNPFTPTIKQISVLQTQTGSFDSLSRDLTKGKIDGIVDIKPKDHGGFSIHLYTSNANPINAAAVKSIIHGVIDRENLVLSNVKNPPLALQDSDVAGRKSRYIDFILPGQIGFSLLSTALFGTVFGFIALRRLQVLKRFFTTPARPLTILLSQATSRMILALIQTSVILIVGVVLFKFYLPQGWLTFAELLFISALGLLAFMGFGLFLSGLASDENAAGPLVNLVTLPQMLLSGVFFSTDSLPSWIQPIANNLPLSYFNAAIRKITTEGGTMTDALPYIVGFLAWGLVMYLLATRTFKWE